MGVMGTTQHSRSIVSLLALTLAVAAGPLPAAAQSGSKAVVCVGSERRTLATNPIRRVYTEDMEIVYRIGADIGQRDQVERDLSSELGSYPEVWCAWSDPGDDHAAIVSYTGVIRQDLTVDPEDPRFQAFSVGFGTDFDAAETQATTINQLFSSYSDGSGYEVLLRETWGVAEGVVAGAVSEESVRRKGRSAREARPPKAVGAEISNHPGCYLWNPGLRDGFSADWSGECSEGFADGRGEVTWQWIDGNSIWSGLLQDGRREWREDGPWTGYDASENVVGTIRFETGQRVGGLDHPAFLSESPSVAARSRGMPTRSEEVHAGACGRVEAGAGSARPKRLLPKLFPSTPVQTSAGDESPSRLSAFLRRPVVGDGGGMEQA